MASSFYPASVTRVSTSQATTRMLFQVNNDQAAIQRLQIQLSTGRRIERPSDDPAAAIRALSAQRSQEFKAQILDNLKSADTILGASESVLSQVQSILNDMRGLAVESSGNLLSVEERTANASQFAEAVSKLIELGNSKFRDQYIFAGANVLQAPLKGVGNAVRFSGTEHSLDTITDFGATLAANVTADATFGTRSDHIVGANDLDPSLLPTTRLQDLNFGEGVRRGAISLSDGTNTVEVDLSNAYTLEDVRAAIESKQLGNRDLKVTIGNKGLSIDYTDALPGILRVGEVGASLTAFDLGIRTAGALSNSPVVGNDLNLIATKNTQLSQLFDGSGIPNASLFTIRQGSKSYTINTAGMNTVEDLINGIESSGAQVKASLDSSGRYFSVQSLESGTTLSISEAGGNTASRLGIRTFDTTTNVSRLNFGQGIFASDQTSDLKIIRTDGSQMLIDLDGVQTVGDVLNRINSNFDNFNPALRITASLSTNGNGIVLSAPTGAQQISIATTGDSSAAVGLGLVPKGQSSQNGVTSGTNSVITGLDVSGVEVEGTFTTLLRLEQAVRSGNNEDMERLVSSLDDDIRRLSESRGVVGARQQRIAEMQSRTEEQQIQLKQVESDEIDADLASVISELTGRQAALQASLQLMGQQSQMSLFDFL